jgi:solute carrier family 25 (mitochondrial folate transporter), member 32
MGAVALASAEASLFGTLTTQPLWVVRTRMLLNTNPHLSDYKSFILCSRQIMRQHGWWGYARGLDLSLILAGTGVLQMYTYEGAKKLYDRLDIPQSFLSEKRFFCGALSKFFSVVLSYPITTVRTRAQQNQYIRSASTKKYAGTVEIIRRTYQDEGLSGFYKGFQANLLRGIMQRGIYFYLYEAMKDLFFAPPSPRH